MVGGGAVTTLGVATLLFLACKQAGHIPLCYLFLYAVAIGVNKWPCSSNRFFDATATPLSLAASFRPPGTNSGWMVEE